MITNSFTSSKKTAREAAGAGPRARRKLWIGFDGLTWTARNGLVRWCVRSPDTNGKHNDPQFARDGCTYTGADKNAGLVAASNIGRGGAFVADGKLAEVEDDEEDDEEDEEAVEVEE